MTRDETLAYTMWRKDNASLRDFVDSPSYVIEKDIREAAERELRNRGEII